LGPRHCRQSDSLAKAGPAVKSRERSGMKNARDISERGDISIGWTIPSSVENCKPVPASPSAYARKIRPIPRHRLALRGISRRTRGDPEAQMDPKRRGRTRCRPRNRPRRLGAASPDVVETGNRELVAVLTRAGLSGHRAAGQRASPGELPQRSPNGSPDPS